MKPETIGAGLVAWVGAALSSLCCLLPLAVITLGLGSGAFMAVTTSIVLDRFPEMTSELLARIADGGAQGTSGHDMDDMTNMGGKARP